VFQGGPTFFLVVKIVATSATARQFLWLYLRLKSRSDAVFKAQNPMAQKSLNKNM
jgi:hypothetical protein